MCKQASFVVVFDRTTESISVHFDKTSDHHSVLLENIGIKEKTKTEPEDCCFVRVEIVPPDGDICKPIAEWRYKLDEPNIDRIPQWYKDSANFCENMVRETLPKYLQSRIVNGSGIGADNSIMSAGDGAKQSAGDGAKQSAGYGATQSAGDGATQSAGDGAKQSAGDGATQSAGDGAKQSAGYGATQSAGDCATQSAGNGAKQSAGYGAKQSAGYNSVMICRYLGDNDDLNIAIAAVGKNGIKPNVWYHVVDGKHVECESPEQC